MYNNKYKGMVRMAVIHEKDFLKFKPINLKVRTDGSKIYKITSKDNLPKLQLLKKKNAENLVLPIEIYDYINRENNDSIVYTTEYYKEYHNAKDVNFKNYYDYEILDLCIYLFSTIKNMHQEMIASGDIHEQNIIINDDLNHRILDFDESLVEQYGTSEQLTPAIVQNITNHLSPEDLRKISYQQKVMIDDKFSLFICIMGLLSNNRFEMDSTFEDTESNIFDYYYQRKIYRCKFPSEIQNRLLETYNNLDVISQDDYFLNIFEDLKKQKYVPPLKKRKTR